MSDRETIREKLADLQRFEDALEESLSEFEHQIRRTNDALERHGGSSDVHHQEFKQLNANRRLALKDLKETIAARRELSLKLAKLDS